MCPSITAKFYTLISNVMAMYTRSPKREDYDRVSRELVKKYPFLKCPLSGRVSSECSSPAFTFLCQILIQNLS